MSPLARKLIAVVVGPIVAIALIIAVVIGVNVVSNAASAHPAPAATNGRDTDSAGRLQNPVTGHTTTTATTHAHPVRVEIPAIHVDSGLVDLYLKPGTHQLQAPLNFKTAGWYRYGTVPGDIGPAVIDGHVDSPTQAGVFLHLSSLKAGDSIIVTLSNKAVKTFTVTSIRRAPKNDFPTKAVYGPTPDAQLRVITCNGIFDKATGHYLDNLVVSATLTTTAGAGQ